MAANRRAGFTLIEVAAVGAVAGIIGAAVGPAVHRARLNARGTGSAANLMQVGQGAGMYAQDNGGRIFSFSWNGVSPNPSGKGYVKQQFTLPDGSTVWTNSDVESAVVQEVDIWQRNVDPAFWDHLSPIYSSRVPHKRRIGLVLLDYLGRALGDELLIDPMDANQLTWAANPFDNGPGSTVPYANGMPGAGYDLDPNWQSEQTRRRWSLSSSYQTTTSAWQAEGLATDLQSGMYVPVGATPHLFVSYTSIPAGPIELSDGRNFAEVRFPSAKVHFFEEFDREQTGSPYFGYDHARPDKLMFDGSVNAWASGDAMPSWNPRDGKREWRQTYVPLDQFPLPLGGLGDDTLLSQRYRWTLGGLQGVDYPQPLMGSRR